MKYTEKALKSISYNLALAEFKKTLSKYTNEEIVISIKQAIKDLERLLVELDEN